ncbi:MAG: AAA family ATPase, partial [Firmicutes bacterium]|nr:AAA family ATPase [Bacillota bacterium]
MFCSSQYHILKLLTRKRTAVFRARRVSDGLPVVLKVLDKRDPTPEESARFRREYEIMRHLSGEGAVSVYSLVKDRGYLVMELEDFGGLSLDRLWSPAAVAWDAFLVLAAGVAGALHAIHARGVVHKDINPSHIVWHPEKGRVAIVDFGMAEILGPGERTYSPGVVEGTLAYVSPEQTGRTGQPVDHRSDLYSLGVTLYELVTGRLPYAAGDAVELVHAHVARRAVPACEVNPEVPEMISRIIEKLMAKTAEERYQSAAGLKADLELCLAEYRTTGRIGVFVAGRHDVGGWFRIPDRLYGREGETEVLLAAVDRVARGTTEVILVSGDPGIGKTSLVQEMRPAVAQRGGFFVAGKFEQFGRGIPYAPLVQALQELLRLILTRDEREVARWKEKLLEALGANGRVVSELIPELELIAGPQPPVQDLPPAESQN